MIRTKYATVSGTAVHYFHAGPTTLPDVVPDLAKGKLLLFVHDAGSNGATWRRQIEALADAHSPLALDYPGHGRSGSTEGLPSVEAYRDFLVAFMEALHLQPCVLVGHGLGGAIALALALAHPAHLRGLVLVATAARGNVPQETLDTWRNVMLGRAQQPFTTDAFSPQTQFPLMREIWTEQVKTDPRVRYHDLLASNAFDITARLDAIGVPTLIVAGLDDRVTPVASAEILQRGIRGAQLVIIEGAGHHVPMEQAEAFNATVRRFVDSLDR
jgi:pimeloyl-ACP methyl ester carboxylesterase